MDIFMGAMTNDFDVWQEDDCIWVRDKRQADLVVHIVLAQAIELRNKLAQIVQGHDHTGQQQEDGA